VKATVDPDDVFRSNHPVRLPATEVRQIPWMGRVVDLGAAFGGRGFGAHSSVEVDLLVEDADAAANSGRWTLAVSAGRGTATRADGGPGRPPTTGSPPAVTSR